ncbi:hypothetical protein RAZWK3B_15408 [Roseobacter sp. AzwK-3b]|nr:hypothetical protein RAZWK3B_15408 [Roseobacter sp. AzwK-3b]
MSELVDWLTIPVGIVGLIAWVHVLKTAHRRMKDKTDE